MKWLIPLLLVSTDIAGQQRIGTLDIYGNRLVPSDSIIAILNYKVGDTIHHNKGFAPAQKLKAIPGVQDVRITPVCCDSTGSLHLFIGIVEIGSHRQQDFNASPTGNITLLPEIVTAYGQFMNKMVEGIYAGQAEEDRSQGHSLMKYEAARKYQEEFIRLAAIHQSHLQEVLRSSAIPEHRAAASAVIAYVPNKTDIINDLVYASGDPSGEVRNNATRSLAIMAEYAALNPEAGLVIPPDRFIAMLNSVVWTDRNKATAVLLPLTATRDGVLFSRLRREALTSLVEMSLWNSRDHAIGAWMILGRIAGIDEEMIGIYFKSPDFREIVGQIRHWLAPGD